jgi:hypothetical protein
MKNRKKHIYPHYTEGHWDETDIKIDLSIYKKINKWTKKYTKASNWLGKWYCQIQIDKLKKKISL